MGPDVSVCVAVYRIHGPPNLRSLLGDLEDACAGVSYEVVLVLNGLPDAGRGLPGNVKVVRFGTNRGVPVAWNHAARQAVGDVLVFANDDVGLGPEAVRML